jgi:hypothetical protein
MRTILCTLAVLAALTLVLAAPVPAQASWLSEAMHAYLDRDDYGYYAYPPGTDYYAPGYSTYYAPGYTTVPGYVYYGGPYYQYVPYRAWYGGDRHWEHNRHDEHHEHHR